MRVLNLYAGIGGNRRDWPVEINGEPVEVVAVENDPEIAAEYARRFPEDSVVVDDAHQYLIDHFRTFDFIWISSPCPSHSRVRAAFQAHGHKDFVYPDFKLYEEIVFLTHFAEDGQMWVSENVVPYYKPLIRPSAVRDRHLFWSNFYIPSAGNLAKRDAPIEHVKPSEGRFGFDLKDAKMLSTRKDKVLRNLVDPQLGRFIWDCAFKVRQEVLL